MVYLVSKEVKKFFDNNISKIHLNIGGGGGGGGGINIIYSNASLQTF